MLLAGCSADYYHKEADKEVYGIIQTVESQIFGRTNEFTIDTPYSQRAHQLILPEEIIEDRTATNRRTINLEDALALAIKNSRSYQTAKEQLYLTAIRRIEDDPDLAAQQLQSLVNVYGQDPSASEALRRC